MLEDALGRVMSLQYTYFRHWIVSQTRAFRQMRLGAICQGRPLAYSGMTGGPSHTTLNLQV